MSSTILPPSSHHTQRPGFRTCLVALIGSGVLLPAAARADLSFETETARILAPGKFEISMAGEYQHSRDGGEFALPIAIEVGVLPRLELLIEPTPYVGIYPKGEKKIHGVGDIETTLTFLAVEEQTYLPAIAFAVEWKAPTARNLNIGTRKNDFAFYLIASKRFGSLDLHANAAYTIIGKPTGVNVKNTWSFALAGDYKLTDKWDVFAEVMYISSAQGAAPRSTSVSTGTTSVSGDGGDGSVAVATPVSAEGAVSSVGSTAVAEVGGVEIIGTMGVRHHLTSNLDIFGSISYDNADAKLFRTGFTIKF